MRKVNHVKFCDISDELVGSLTEVIQNLPKLKIRETTIQDLLVTHDTEEAMRHGIYVFFDENLKPCYIGKNSSRHFIDRLTSHLLLSPGFIDNGIAKKVANKAFSYNTIKKESHEKVWESQVNALTSASKLFLDYKVSIILCGFGTKSQLNAEGIAELEKLLIWKIKPEFNKRDKKSGSIKQFENMTVAESIKQLADQKNNFPTWLPAKISVDLN